MNCEIVLLLLATTLSSSVTQRGVEKLSYVVGENASLPCPQLEKPYKFIKLFKQVAISSENIFTVVFRNGKLNKMPKEKYKKRITFNTAYTSQFFLLKNLLHNDEGTFECRIVPQHGSAISTKSTLYVIEPASEVIIKDSTGKQVATLAGPYNEKELVELTCEAIGGRPPPKVTWFKNGTQIKSKYVGLNNKTKSILKIGPLRRNHTKFSYHCTASNHRNAVVVSEPVNLSINTIPTLVKFITDEKPLEAEKSSQIECLVEGSKPPAKIYWLLDQISLLNHSEGAIDENKLVQTSNLIFTPKIEDAGKKLLCYAKNPDIEHKPLNVSRILDIYYPPNVTLSFFPRSTVNEGDPVRLDCEVRANPPPFEVLFYKGHVKLTSRDNNLEISNRSVSLIKSTRHSSGPYSCVARNSVGLGSSDPQSLKINHEPQCRNRVNQVGVSRNETINVTCVVDSWPAVTHFHWQFNRSGEISYINSGYTSDDFSSVIKYIPKSEGDFGSLLCWAKNAYGKMEKPCVFSIVKAELPDRLENCTQVNRTSETFFVVCISGRDGGLPQKFVAELFDTSQRMYVLNATSETPQFLMEELSHDTLYFLTLYSENSKGHSEKVHLHVNTSSVADRPGIAIPTLGNFPLTPVLSVLIGVVAVLALVSLITAGIMHMRGREPEKQKQVKEKHTQLLLADSEKSGSDKSGIPNKLKTPNLYVPPLRDSSKDRKEQKPESSDVEYAEVKFANKPRKDCKKEDKKKKKCKSKIKNSEENTLYASIDYSKMDKKTTNKALVNKVGSNGKPILNIPPPPNDQVALNVEVEKVTHKCASPSPKSILSKKNDKPPIPLRPANLLPPPKSLATKENQTVSEEDSLSKETIPLMQTTLESNL